MTEYLTVTGLDEILHDVGLAAKHVARTKNAEGEPEDHAMYFDCAIGANGDDRMILVVTTYSLNERGARYIGMDGTVAMETRRFFIESMGSLTPCPTVEEEANTR